MQRNLNRIFEMKSFTSLKVMCFALLLMSIGFAWGEVEAFGGHLCNPAVFDPNCGTNGHTPPPNPDPDPEPEPDPQTEIPDDCSGPLTLLPTATPENNCQETDDKPNEDPDLPVLDGEEDPGGRTESPVTCDVDVDCEDGVPHFEMETIDVPMSDAERGRIGVGPDAVKIQAVMRSGDRGTLNSVLVDAFDVDGDGSFLTNPSETASMACSVRLEGPPGSVVSIVDTISGPIGPSCSLLYRLRLLFSTAPETGVMYCFAATVSTTRETVRTDSGGLRFKPVAFLWWCFEFLPDMTPTSRFMDDPPPNNPDGGGEPDGGDEPDIVEIPVRNEAPQPTFERLDVVINEVGWPGTAADPTHQFIELYNNSAFPIELENWVLQTPDGRVRIQLRGTIQSNGYFLLEHPSNATILDIPADQLFTQALSDESDSLELIAPDGTIIDTANDNGGAWPAGFRLRGIIACMERINPQVEDMDDNWDNNNTLKRNGLDANGQPINCTPRAANSVRQVTGVAPDVQTGRDFADSVSSFPVNSVNAPGPQLPSFFGKTITVDDDGEADFSSIQAAVNEAFPGDIIEVAPGIYRGQVLIRRDNITIVGAGAGQTILEHNDVVVIFAGTRGGLLTGVTVNYTGTDPHAAVVIFSARATLENNVITGATRSGVDVQGEGAHGFLKQNLIENNQGSGVFVHRDAEATLEANTILNNGQDGQAGVEIKGNVIANLLSNLIEASGGSGVFIHEGAEVELQFNLIVDNTFHGVSVPGAATVLLTQNAIMFNDQLGVRVRDETAEVTLLSNLIAYNVIGILTVNNTLTFMQQNLWFQNSEATVGKGLAPDEADLNTALLFQSSFVQFSNGLELLRISLDIQGEDSTLTQPNVLEGLQASFLVVAQLYADQGFLQIAGNWYLLVVQLDASSELAEQARQNLGMLSNL